MAGDVRRRTLGAAAAGLAVAGAVATAGAAPAPAGAPRLPDPRTTDRRVVPLGASEQGRPLRAIRVGDRASRNDVLLVGAIHGDERAGVPILRDLRRARPDVAADVWVVDDANPDGARLGRRQNANGVDLNRNFPEGWRRSSPGSRYFSGRGPCSEAECRALRRLIRRLRPQVTVWFHQPLAFVVEPRGAGDDRIARRYARRVGLPARAYPRRLRGTATAYSNALLPGTTAFVVELPPGRATRAERRRHVRALLALARRGDPRPDGG